MTRYIRCLLVYSIENKVKIVVNIRNIVVNILVDTVVNTVVKIVVNIVNILDK